MTGPPFVRNIAIRTRASCTRTSRIRPRPARLSNSTSTSRASLPRGGLAGDRRDPRRRLASIQQGRVWPASGLGVRAQRIRRRGPELSPLGPQSAVVAINYQDVQSAVLWVKANASRYGIDPTRVVAMGESAGANLANLLGTQGGADTAAAPGLSASVQAVVSFSSPTDLAALQARSPQAGRAVVQFLGGKPTAIPQLYEAASPVDPRRRRFGPDAPHSRRQRPARARRSIDRAGKRPHERGSSQPLDHPPRRGT